MKKIVVGEIYKSLNYGDFEIINYENSLKVTVKFLKTGYVTITKSGQVRTGMVMDRVLPSFFGVGYLGEQQVDKTCFPIWQGMIGRCYNEKRRNYYHTYQDCVVSEAFKNFTNFYEWCHNQVGFNEKDDKNKPFELDKDLLFKGSKVYSEDTCVFLPKEINSMLTHRKKSRGDYPVGVMLEKGKFRAMICTNGIGRRLGSFDSVTEAFNAYKQAKESYIKEVADRWKDRIDPRAYEALYNYTVDIDD